MEQNHSNIHQRQKIIFSNAPLSVLGLAGVYLSYSRLEGFKTLPTLKNNNR
jgi:hypothetical protein